ncbi:MAG: L-rhamnose isomerase, partial [Clostridia bacterium]|nr:L-rhamnose isomerase [Clostridia bacterium]
MSTMYELAKARYQAIGIDTEAVMKVLSGIPISIH